jgi:hypothetical protein
MAQIYHFEVLVKFADGRIQAYYPQVEDAAVNYTSFKKDDGWVFPRIVDGVNTPDWFAAEFVRGVSVSPFKGLRIPLKSGGALYVKPPVNKDAVVAALDAEIEKRQLSLNALKEELLNVHNPVPVPSAGKSS